MDYPVGMAKLQGQKKLVNDFFDLVLIQRIVLKVLFEIAVAVLKN